MLFKDDAFFFFALEKKSEKSKKFSYVFTQQELKNDQKNKSHTFLDYCIQYVVLKRNKN